MSADKNFSEKKPAKSKITTKDSHMYLPRSRSHIGPTNPKNKSKQVAKRKHNSRSKGLRQICLPGTDGPTSSHGRSVKTSGWSDPLGRTVRIEH
jgi:hypothetical protein